MNSSSVEAILARKGSGSWAYLTWGFRSDLQHLERGHYNSHIGAGL